VIPIGMLGRVSEGDYKNWYVMVHDTPGMGLLVVKALDAEMSNTKLFHGPLKDLAEVEEYFNQQNLKVDWESGPGGEA